MKQSKRKIQIGVMGSAADLKYAKRVEKLAEDVGYNLAKASAVVLFGAEKDYDSLSTAAARGAKKAGGLTVGVTYGKGTDVYEKNIDVVIATGLERGGGRELPLVLSCDAVILISGGSGTLTEAAIAYQANIPVVALTGTGGWSDKLAGTYIDGRKRIKVQKATTAEKAVELALKLAKKNEKNPDITLLATYSTDRLINKDGGLINEQAGGPALFISSVLKNEDVEFDSISPEPVIVEILTTENRELGRIPNPPKLLQVNFPGIKSPAIIISTLLNEIDLENISSFQGQVFLDIQGYVRDGRDFGKKKYWRPTEEIIDTVSCLKATTEETKYIDPKFLEELKNKMLLVTHGSNGSTLYCQGKKYIARPKKVISTDNTIGAGDTLFAYFVSQLIQGKSPFDSLECATTKTSEFLKHSH